MLARRIIALSPDKAFAKQLATACKAAGGAVDSYTSLDELGKGELQVALAVLHLDGDLANIASDILPRLQGDARVIAILPRSNLSNVVDVMQASDRLAGILVAEAFEGTELSAMVTRVLSGDIFGLEKRLHWGTQVHSQLVGDYQDKSLCIAQISEFAESMGVRRKYRESIEQCVDEMLMNALYDAPTDEQGKPIFSEIPTKTRISLRVEQKIVVQYACDGKHFAVSVRDAFGTLERATVLRYIYKCLHTEQQIDRKAGGAGLGLYLIVNSASSVYFHVPPGVATEAQTTFDLETPKLQLEQFGFFSEKIDAGGRLAAGPSRRLPVGASHPVERRQDGPLGGGSRGLIAALSIAIFAMFVLIGFVAWPRLFGGKHLTKVEFATTPKGVTIDIEGHNAGTASNGSLMVNDLEVGRTYPVLARLDGYEQKELVVQPRDGANRVTITLKAQSASVDVDSQPTGATIEVDGNVLGVTPLTITTLTPGTPVTIVFKKTGYHDATGKLEVPGPGKTMRLVQPLAVSDEFARVHLVSDPPGAQVIQNGQLLAGVTTPADVLVEAGKPQRFMLTLPHRVPAAIDPFIPPRGSDGLTKTGKLLEGTSVRVEANIEAKVSVTGTPHCQNISLPNDCVLAPGKYKIELVGGPNTFNARAFRDIVVGKKELTESFEFGFVEAAPNKQIELGGGAIARRLALEAGPRNVVIGDTNGTHTVSVRVKPNTTVIAN